MIFQRRGQGSSGTRAGRLALAALLPTLVVIAACGAEDSSSSPGDEPPTAAFPDLPATGTPIKIGIINPEGGPTVSLPGARQAAEAAVQYANAHLGGIAGHRIEAVNCAMKEDPASTRDCANRMVEQKVAAVVVTASAFGDTMVPIITGAGIPYVVANAASAAEMTTPGAYSLTGGYPGTLQSMAAYAGNRGHKKVSLVVFDSPASVATANSLGRAAFEARGIELRVIPIPPGTPDATPQVSSAIGDDADAVAVATDPTVCTSVLKALDTLGATQEKLLISPCSDASTVEAVGDAIEGASVFSSADVSSDDPEAVLYRDVLDRYAGGAEIGGASYAGYQGMLGVVRASQALAGEPSAAAVGAAIAAARNVPLPLGHGISFSCDGSVPGLPTICSLSQVRVTMRDGKPADPEVTE
ncbi:ABC transporter substrate-binding protein [Nocardia harenae]|uniref:ABC transporter substrate-binding protein n=1 Tax=Nocardia harenae TaxID=358707 RepID=UPI000AF4830B|nr:ABC transporter substrate-binding protein [Nocardia harenae]